MGQNMDLKILQKAWACRDCRAPHEFETFRPEGGYHKFPPVIGKQQDADILFVGLKPRRSDSNLVLHESIMGDFGKFADLAKNRVNGKPYIGEPRQEEHYRFHYEVTEAIYGHRVPFENYAAVTELWLCAALDKHGLPKNTDGSIRRNRECRENFLLGTVERIKPVVIIALGRFVVENLLKNPPERLLREGEIAECSFGGRRQFVIHAPHPGGGFSWRARDNVAEKTRSCLQDRCR